MATRKAPWRSGPSGTTLSQAERPRKMVALTLSDDERAQLAEMAEAKDTSKSALVGELIRKAFVRFRR